MLKNPSQLVISVSLCLFVGFAGSIITSPSMPIWYATLQKPIFSPPNWIFAPVWTILYILMGIAAYLVWRQGLKKKIVRFALKLFLLQLALNFLWSVIFFGFKLPLVALGDIIFLWIAIFVTMKSFSPINKNAALLLLPYLLWVSFAVLLNAGIVLLNR